MPYARTLPIFGLFPHCAFESSFLGSSSGGSGALLRPVGPLKEVRAGRRPPRTTLLGVLSYAAVARQAAPAAGLLGPPLLVFSSVVVGPLLCLAVLHLAGVPLGHAFSEWWHGCTPEPDPHASNTWPPPHDEARATRGERRTKPKHDEWPHVRMCCGLARRGHGSYVRYRRRHRRHTTCADEDDAEVRATSAAPLPPYALPPCPWPPIRRPFAAAPNHPSLMRPRRPLFLFTRRRAARNPRRKDAGRKDAAAPPVAAPRSRRRPRARPKRPRPR